MLVNKIFSSLVFASVTSVVLFGSYKSVDMSLHNSSNLALVHQVFSQFSSPVIATAGLRWSKPVSLASSTSVQTLGVSTAVQVDKPYCIETGSIVRLLDKQGIDSSFTNRTKLAVKYGIKQYRGTTDQNVSLISFVNRDLDCIWPKS